jgi:hypothetical protein
LLGVFMFLNRDVALAEFARVLKPGGRLYVCTNARGWWLKLATGNVRKNWSLARTGWNSFLHGRSTAIPNATDIRDVEALLGSTWRDVSAGPEGTLGNNVKALEPVYPARFAGFDNVIEFTANKSGVSGVPSRAPTPVLTKPVLTKALERQIGDALAASTYSYRELLNRYPMPSEYAPPPSATNVPAVEVARATALRMDRSAALRRIFQMATADTSDAENQVVRCIFLTQKLFYHHFAAQPLFSDGRLLLDPIASVLFGAVAAGTRRVS